MNVCQDVTGLPVSPLLIFNSSWPAPECGAGGPDYDKYNQHCNGLVSAEDTGAQLYSPLVCQVLRDSLLERPQHQVHQQGQGAQHR